MPLLDSFTVDHTRMEAPAVRVAKTMNTPHGDAITVFDLRFCVPNKEVMPERGIHTLEHLFAGFMRNHLNGNGVEIIDISPMGCRTGFYMSLIGTPDEQRVADAWKAAMEDVLKVQDLLQRTADQQRLEGFFGDGALNWINSNTFARQIGSKSLCRDKRGKRCRKKYAMSHCYSFFWQGDMPGVTGQVQSYLMNGRVSRPTGPVVYQRRLPRLRESRPTACVRRSRIMARITIPTPPTVASPISRRPIPRSTI